ncbi:MAG: hypothetical protein AB7Q17_07090 [Phycisphaerae bacterium]
MAGASPAFAADPFWAFVGADSKPREPTIGVGPARIIQTTNFAITAYDRTGTQLWQAALDPNFEPLPLYFWDGFPSPPPSDTIGDPRVLYDHFSGRFVVIALHFNARKFMLAVSRDDTPDSYGGSDWDKYYLDGRVDGVTTGIINWPGLAVNQSAIYLVTVMPTDAGGRHVVQILERPTPGDADFYTRAGNHQRFVLSLVGGQPDDFKDRLPMPALFRQAIGSDTMYFAQLERRGLTDPPLTPRIRVVALQDRATELSWSFDDAYVAADAPEIGTLYQLCDASDLVQADFRNVQNAVLDNGRLYLVRQEPRTQVNDGLDLPGRWTARWYVVDLRGWPSSGLSPVLEDDGVLDCGHSFGESEKDDWVVHAKYPLIMPTTNGDFAIFFTRFSRRSYFDLCWTGRRASDPPGVLGAPVTVMTAGSAAISDPGLLGDYEGIALDPLDGTRTWGTSETGRCFLELDNPCPSCTVGVRQDYKHTSVGSYVVSGGPLRTLTVARALGNQPDAINVKLSPSDVYARADAELNAGEPSFARNFGDGAPVTLLAPEIDGWTFFGWIIDIEGDGPAAPTSRMTTVTLNANRTATPYYTQP